MRICENKERHTSMQRDWKDLPEPRSVHQPITSITGFGSETLRVLRTRTPTNESPCCCSGRHATLAALKTRESKCRAIALHIIPGCVILSQKSHYITLKGSPKAEVWGVIRIHFHATISIYFIQIQSMMHNTYCSTLRKSAWLSQSRACQVKKNI